jgi:hypothetical protein
MYKCKICGKKFEDLFKHLNNEQYGLMDIKDKAHHEYMKRIDNCDKEMSIGYDSQGNDYEGISGYKLPCFCEVISASMDTEKTVGKPLVINAVSYMTRINLLLDIICIM